MHTLCTVSSTRPINLIEFGVLWRSSKIGHCAPTTIWATEVFPYHEYLRTNYKPANQRLRKIVSLVSERSVVQLSLRDVLPNFCYISVRSTLENGFKEHSLLMRSMGI